MKTFEVYEREGDYKFVKKGWSWPAFFFGIFWFLYKRLWTESLIIAIVSLLLHGFFKWHVISIEVFHLFRVIILIFFGMYGNRLFAKDLIRIRKGYTFVKLVEGKNKDDVMSKFYLSISSG